MLSLCRCAEEKQQQYISAKKNCFCSFQLKIPAKLPNVFEILKIFAAALLKSTKAGLSKDETARLQTVAIFLKPTNMPSENIYIRDAMKSI